MKSINPYMKIQIKNQVLEVDNFIKLLRGAAVKDDGVIDANEESIIKKIEKASEKYRDILKEYCDG